MGVEDGKGRGLGIEDRTSDILEVLQKDIQTWCVQSQSFPSKCAFLLLKVILTVRATKIVTHNCQ